MIVRDFCSLTCATCAFNEGYYYGQFIPVQYKCAFDGSCNDGYHRCHLELVPVVHARWEDGDGNVEYLYGNLDDPYEVPTYRCSACKSEEELASDYCPNCGAVMDLEEQL